MAEAAKGINPDITPEEVKEEVKEATAEVVEKAPSLASSYTLYAMAATLVLALLMVTATGSAATS